MHKRDQESVLIDSLREGHTITAACKRAGVSRMFYDRHYKSDRRFKKLVDEARANGRKTNDDLIETVYYKKVREGHWPAVQYALKKRDAAEAKTPDTSILGMADIRIAIDVLPEAARNKHYTHLRELLDDLAEFERTGKVPIRKIDDL